MDTEDRRQLKKLIKKYEVKNIIKEINNIRDEYFAFWKKQYDIEHNTIENNIIHKDKNKIIKKAANIIISKTEDETHTDMIQKDDTKDIILNNIQIQKDDMQCHDIICDSPDTNITIPDTSEVKPDTIEEKKQKCNADIKREQREKQALKRAELDKKGITIELLLTEQNLRKWIIDENRTYAYIARELVGCSEDNVSIVARSFGIKSNVTAKKRAIMYANR
jgi:hypothetical protein